jgi:ABC-type transport system substrate-binding protein
MATTTPAPGQPSYLRRAVLLPLDLGDRVVQTAGDLGRHEPRARLGLQAFALVWTADHPRQDAFLFPQFAATGSDNLTHFRNPAVDQLLTQARATADDPARSALYQRAEDALLTQLPVVPVLWQRHAAALAPGLRGFDLTPQGLVDLAEVSLAN